MLRRSRPSRSDAETPPGASGAPGGDDAAHGESDGESHDEASAPATAVGRIRPDDSVLDELSRVFGAVSPTGDSDDTARSAPDPLADPLAGPRAGPRAEARGGSRGGSDREPTGHVADSPDGADIADVAKVADGRSGGVAPRRTVTIGDELDLGAPDPVPLDEALGRPGSLGAAGADRDGGVATTARRGPTIAIGGDDLPDAVYLDDQALDDSGSAGTVFIDDDGTGDALAPKDATTPGIEPRFRQRRIGVRRAENRRRLKWIAIGGVVVVVLVAVLTVLGSGLFAIDQVSVTGNIYTDENRLQLVIDELEGTPVLLADTERAERDLEAIPWVEHARVRARFPDRATIEIRERTPVATMRGADGRFRVLDEEGRVLDVIEGQPVAYVLIAGPGTLDLAAGEFAPIGQSAAASLVTKLTPTVRPRVEAIEVTADGSDLVLILSPAADSTQTTPITVRFGSAIGDNDQIEKLVRLEQKLDDLPDVTVSEINVATDEVTVQ